MAKCWGALFSQSAHGKFGFIVYQSGDFGQTCKALTPQRYKPSANQLKLNYAFGITAENWHALTEEQKQEYNDNAVGMKMTGFNLYVKEHFHENIPE